MAFPLSPDILDELCDLLPPRDAKRLRELDRTSYEAHVAAYLAVRRGTTPVPHRIRVAVVAALFAFHDRAVAERHEPCP